VNATLPDASPLNAALPRGLDAELPRGLSARLLLVIVPLVIVCGLALDQHGGALGQPIVVTITWVVFGALLLRTDSAGRTMMLTCLVYATVGEVLLSLVWQVYDYRLGNLPLFVPPGHVLLFLLGLSVTPRVTPTMVRAVVIGAVLVVAALAVSARDTFSAVLTVVFVASVVLSRHRALYAAMFVLALVMELYGTWLGNWHWNAQVGTTGLVTLNPPVAAGAFYCALDLLVMLGMHAFGYGGLAAAARGTLSRGDDAVHREPVSAGAQPSFVPASTIDLPAPSPRRS